ncbi:MAG TPA: alpha/beta hydrolase [Puia sp.]|nr:alpha/beta hydrolase [Puia sp.]
MDKTKDLPVMLIHGFAEDSTVWDGIASRLENTCRLLIPDLPGSGSSPLPEGEISIDTLAAHCVGLLEKENLDRCIFIGHSMGGYITLAIAEHYPEKVLAFGLFHSTAYADTEEKKANRRKSIDFIRQYGATPYIRQSTPNLFAAGTREHRPQLVENMILRYSGFSGEALVAFLNAMMQRPDRLSVLERFTVLFIIGEKDQIVPMEQSLKQSHMPPISQVRVLREAGHMGMLEDPDAGSGAIRSFINFIQQS